MPVSLFIHNVPDDVAERLCEQATSHGRTLEDELLSIMEAAIASTLFLKPSEVYEKVKAPGLRNDTSSVEIIRADRDRDENRFDD